ncbi:MAG: hypothetical protein AAB787_02535 [Patescibacteria group bacterium]
MIFDKKIPRLSFEKRGRLGALGCLLMLARLRFLVFLMLLARFWSLDFLSVLTRFTMAVYLYPMARLLIFFSRAE